MDVRLEELIRTQQEAQDVAAALEATGLTVEQLILKALDQETEQAE